MGGQSVDVPALPTGDNQPTSKFQSQAIAREEGPGPPCVSHTAWQDHQRIDKGPGSTRRKRGETVLVEAKLDGQDVEALIDTGSNCSLMRKDLWEKLMDDAKKNPKMGLLSVEQLTLRPFKGNLYDAFGQSMKPVGIACPFLYVGEIMERVPFVVCEDLNVEVIVGLT